MRQATLRCTGCGRKLPDEAFPLNKSRPNERRGRRWRCHECVLAWYQQPGRCAECGEPTPSRKARLCDDHYVEHMRGVASDFYLDRFGHNGLWDRKRVIGAIQKWEREHGSPPRMSDWKRRRGREVGLGEAARWPAASTVQRLFGTWNAAIKAAGFTPRFSAKSGRTMRGRS